MLTARHFQDGRKGLWSPAAGYEARLQHRLTD